jgi:hypothetical protein
MKNRLLLLVTLILLLVIGGYFFPINTPKTTELNTSLTPAKRIINKSITAETPVKKSTRKPPIKQVTKASNDDSEQMREIKRCYPEINSRSNHPIEDAFEQLSADQEFRDEIDFKNFHYTLPNGEQRRLQIRIDEDPQGGVYKVLKLYKLDNEGLPEPIAVDKKIAHNPTEDTIESFLSEGSISFTQDIGNRIFSEKNYISFVKENGQLQSLEVYRDNRVLRCSVNINEVTNCKCNR